jgi:hypothetical protein
MVIMNDSGLAPGGAINVFFLSFPIDITNDEV